MNQLGCKYASIYSKQTITTICKFKKSPLVSSKYFTNDLRNALDIAAKDLKFTNLNDWYKVPVKVSSSIPIIYILPLEPGSHCWKSVRKGI